MKKVIFSIGIFTGLGLAFLRAVDSDPEIEARNALIRSQSETAFDLIPLKYDATGKAPIHFIDPAVKFFVDDGKRYFGFRFRTPTQIEGDFSWMFLLRNADGPQSTGPMGWYIVRKNGSMTGFSHWVPRMVSEYPDLRARFPFTNRVTLQSLPKSAFLPDEEYIIWFSFLESEKPVQFAVAFSFTLPGSDWTSRLPLGKHVEPPKGPDTRKSTRQSAEGDPW